jgi:hypothetical protein
MKKILLLIVILFSISLSFAQEEELSEKEKARREKNIQAGNPFKRFGYTPKIATLSKGKYLEFHDLDSIVRIGSYSYHVKKKEITGYTKLDTVHPESTLRPEIISRWFSPDPLSDEFPSWSPYSFVYNNPVRFIDPDGRAAEDVIILINPKSAYGLGHMAMLIGDDKNGWTFVSKNGRADTNGDDNQDGTILTGGKSTSTIKSFGTLDDALSDGTVQSYKQGYRIKTTEKQDAKMLEIAKKDVKTKYNVITNNCADNCSKALKSAGKDAGGSTSIRSGAKMSPSTIPNERYDEIVENNTGKTISIPVKKKDLNQSTDNK